MPCPNAVDEPNITMLYLFPDCATAMLVINRNEHIMPANRVVKTLLRILADK